MMTVSSKAIRMCMTPGRISYPSPGLDHNAAVLRAADAQPDLKTAGMDLIGLALFDVELEAALAARPHQDALAGELARRSFR